MRFVDDFNDFSHQAVQAVEMRSYLLHCWQSASFQPHFLVACKRCLPRAQTQGVPSTGSLAA